MQVPLGPLYLGACLVNAGHEVIIVDMRDGQKPVPKADFYGFSCTTADYPYALDIAKTIEGPTIVGGPHATHMPEECSEHFDYVVRGEGERAIVDIVEGIVDDNIISYPPIKDLDSIPFPAWDLMPYNRVFTKTLYVGERYGVGPISTAITSSRGCPFNCAFCANWDRSIRFRSPENFAEEVSILVRKYACSHYKVIDDNFTLNKKRLKKMADLLEPMKIRFRCHTRSHLFDEETAEALYRAGCREISFGVEVADDELLKFLNKRETVEEHERAIRIAKETGFTVKVYLMVCLPGETWETIEKQKEFMRRNAKYVDKWTLSTFVPYPGCDIWKNPEKYGIKWMERDYRKFWLYEDDPLIETEVASWEELREHRRHLYEYLLSEKWKKSE